MAIKHARGIAGRLIHQKQAVLRLRDTVKKRVFPAFDSAMDEAIAIADEELLRLREKYKDDPDAIITWEEAWEEGRVYLQDIDRLRNALKNMMTAALHHMFEQQLCELWSDLTYETTKDRETAPTLREVVATFRDYGLNCESFETWGTLEELRLVANVVKHGKGRASRELTAHNQKLFPVDWSFKPFIGRPLEGYGFVVWQWEKYFEAVAEFWDEMAEAFLNCADNGAS
ncbi:MAG TPA: hypothetical protein VF006_23035 [Longimicrobium sp.]